MGQQILVIHWYNKRNSPEIYEGIPFNPLYYGTTAQRGGQRLITFQPKTGSTFLVPLPIPC